MIFRTGLVLSLLTAAPLLAHETFVAPATAARVGAPLELRLSSTGTFPRSETAILPTRIAGMSATIATAPQRLRKGRSGPTWLALEAQPATPGLMLVAVALGPKALALTPAKVEEYFADIEATEAVRAAYAEKPAPRQWNESYTKYNKAFVCVAPCPDTASAALPVGHALEFVAADAGLTRFVVLANGRPLGEQPVQIFDAAGVMTRGKSDAEGRFEVPATVARPLLLGSTVVRLPAKTGGAFTSDFATLWVGK